MYYSLVRDRCVCMRETDTESSFFLCLWFLRNWTMFKSCKGHLWQIDASSHFIHRRIFTPCTVRGRLIFIAPPGKETYGGSTGTNFMIWITNQCMYWVSAVERLADNKTSCFCNSHFNLSVTKYGFAVTQVCKNSQGAAYSSPSLALSHYSLWDYTLASDQWLASSLPPVEAILFPFQIILKKKTWIFFLCTLLTLVMIQITYQGQQAK